MTDRRTKMIVIGTLTAAMTDALARAGHDDVQVITVDSLPDDFEPDLRGQPELTGAGLDHTALDEMAARMKLHDYKPEPFIPRERHHPTSPRQRGGR